MTGYYINSKNKMYHLVYDFGWLEFSDGDYPNTFKRMYQSVDPRLVTANVSSNHPTPQSPPG